MQLDSVILVYFKLILIMSLASDFFTSIVNTLEFQQSYMTIDDARVIDPTYRSSKICTQKINTQIPQQLDN